MTEKETVTLARPVVVDGAEITTLAMRRPRVRDLRDARRGGGGDDDHEIRLFANLCEVSPETIAELDVADWMALQKVYKGFLGEAESPA